LKRGLHPKNEVIVELVYIMTNCAHSTQNQNSNLPIRLKMKGKKNKRLILSQLFRPSGLAKVIMDRREVVSADYGILCKSTRRASCHCAGDKFSPK
jgi:hypothetical protein